MELKYDGEHILVHKYGQNLYKYLTRNGFDYTNQLGVNSNTKLSAKIHSYFAQSVSDCILDCELLIYDIKKKCFSKFLF